MVEIDNIITKDVNILEGKVILKGEIPGMAYIINRPPTGVTKLKLDYCAFYDVEKENCSIYEDRPNICKTYGDPKYNSCPYENYSEPGALTKLLDDDPGLAQSLHVTAVTNEQAYLNDFIDPFVEAFKNSDQEYMTWWESLPAPNFIRNQKLMDSLDLVSLAQIRKG